VGKAPAFQMYSGDFYMDTNHWTIEEIGIYTRLLLTEWSQGSLPSEIPRLARIAGCGSKKFQLWWGSISFKFIPDGKGQLINKRLEEEREKQRKYRELQSEKGKVGAEHRWLSDGRGHSRGDACANGRTMALQSSSSSSIKRKKYIKKEKISDDDFLKQIKETYSWVDFELEMKKMDLWLSNNPQRKKTRKFILNWFGRKEKPITTTGEDKYADIYRDK